MKRKMLAAASLLSLGIIAGCGSSSSVSTNGIATSTVSGKVADGYLSGAKVFLDKNLNYQLDAGEPTATTDKDGNFTLTVDPADIGKYPIVAVAVKGVTVDQDTNQAVPGNYLLSMPKEMVGGAGNFVSPVSSQVREMMETGKFANMQQAMDELRAKMGMPAGTNMMADYIALKNGAMHNAATNMATLMGSQMSQLYADSGVASVDVNRYRGMMGAIFTNMSTIRGGQAPAAMSSLMTKMMADMVNIKPGQPFMNMSSTFRGLMGSMMSSGGIGSTMGSGASTGGMMGSSSGTGGMMGANSGGSMMR